ncbi:Uncharacterized protein PECH_000549 [Penicillium ucsense]|uniref:FHA domain-containing protein n=1 Tax=Penicillium ucsense TaxID=2839758 RepID=A0A8J8WH27_9EURO|nr:Uncharacterized protein PECM_008889 [Penicillium ucsense]KAF7733508.1 Uncharacterized protein PECH_000549 [Penicillium ucsense]
MWILDTAGDFLDGKRLWLRPGKQYLFGRVKGDDVRHVIPNKSISRKHMLIEISNVEPRDGTRTHARTKVSITDLDSSRGTVVNGEKIQGKRALSGDENSILLGNYPHALRIKWEPVVLSFSFSSKEMRAEDPLAQVRNRLESLDIKTIIPYLVGQTTHVVQSKRNTAKGLQALINGKYIVQHSYIDALVYATTPTDLGNDASLSPLELDFDSAWPDPTEHLPPAGNEPVGRPAAAFAPDPARVNVFEGYTFIFGDASQFDNLQEAINNGQGKALFYQIKDGETTAQELVQYMRSAAGQKGIGSEQEGQGGVVLVRFRSKGKFEPWSIELGNEVAIMTDQRVIEQREFLDAILSNDASPLCRPLPRADGSDESQANTKAVPRKPAREAPMQDTASVPPFQEESSSALSQRKTSGTRKYVSKMKAFDDGFDIESVPVYTPVDEDVPATQLMVMGSSQINEVSHENSDAMEQDEEDTVAELLPGARAMKRRRAEMSEGRDEKRKPSELADAVPKPKRAKLDIREAARKHREEEEQEQKRQAEEHLQASQDIDVEKMRDLAIVEEMDIPLRKPPQGDHQTSERWDDKWNGRKNFKRFRRKGEPQHARRIQSVIVPLEEVTRKDFGIGEHYWVSSTKSTQVSQPSEQDTQQTRQSSVADNQESEQPESSIAISATPDPTPGSQSLPSRNRSQKRPRETRDSDSDEEPRFSFRRKR